MNKNEFCNYSEKAKWAKKWNKAKNKILVTKNFCKAFPKLFDINTWYGRTIARNNLVRWGNKYNEGTLRSGKRRGNWVPKKKVSINDLSENDRRVYQEIVEDILKHNNISKDEIARRMIKKKKETDNQKKMSSLFGLSNKSYYWKIDKKPTRVPKDRKRIKEIILEFKKGFYRNLGYESTYEYLLKNKLIDNSIKIWDIRKACEELSLMSNRVGRKSQKPKEIKDTKNIKPNLIKNLVITRPNQVWATDISFLKVKGGFVYLSAIIDAFSKKIVGFKISSRNDTKLVIDSLNMALKYQKAPDVIHSDNGYQYTSKWYLEFTDSLKINVSKSAPGKSLENREIEFWFSLLKREHLYKIKNIEKNKINKETSDYITWYNTDRIKKGIARNLAWFTPDEVHAYYSD